MTLWDRHTDKCKICGFEHPQPAAPIKGYSYLNAAAAVELLGTDVQFSDRRDPGVWVPGRLAEVIPGVERSFKGVNGVWYEFMRSI